MAEELLTGSTALVTGAGRRLGSKISIALASHGVHVVLHVNRSSTDAEKIAGKIRSLGVQSWIVQADFQEDNDYESLIARSVSLAGSIDILINNASIFPPSRLEDLEFSELERNMKINAWVPLALSRILKKHSKRGKIINILDTKIGSYDSGHTGYILSKYILGRLTKWTALEFAPGFTVNAVAPGLILPPSGKDVSYLRKMGKRIPMQRHGDADDVTAAVLFLLKSPFITGQILFVDGGRHLLGNEQF